MSDKLQLLQWLDHESGIHLCAHPRFDLISQGRSKEEAYIAFMSAVTLTVLFRADDDGHLTLPLTPPDVAARWAEAAQRQRPAQEKP